MEQYVVVITDDAALQNNDSSAERQISSHSGKSAGTNPQRTQRRIKAIILCLSATGENRDHAFDAYCNLATTNDRNTRFIPGNSAAE